MLKTKDNSGLSLIELMIVVAIIGILSAMAIPRFQQFQAKAKQSEAKNNLTHIYSLQQAYHGEHDEYAGLGSMGLFINGGGGVTDCNGGTNQLGFRLTDCRKIRYNYGMTVNTTSSFTARAESGDEDPYTGKNLIVPGCTTPDIWIIDQNKTLENTSNAVALCL